jgi:hypothetical protein
VVQLQTPIAASGSAVFAGFVGIRWEGEVDNGFWTWMDDSPDTLIDGIGFCEGEPEPTDFFPNLFLGNPEHRAVMEDELHRLRLALVLNSAGAWCLGLPYEATGDPEGDYGPDRGHFICERPAPDPAAYAFGFPLEEGTTEQ